MYLLITWICLVNAANLPAEKLDSGEFLGNGVGFGYSEDEVNVFGQSPRLDTMELEEEGSGDAADIEELSETDAKPKLLLGSSLIKSLFRTSASTNSLFGLDEEEAEPEDVGDNANIDHSSDITDSDVSDSDITESDVSDMEQNVQRANVKEARSPALPSDFLSESSTQSVSSGVNLWRISRLKTPTTTTTTTEAPSSTNQYSTIEPATSILPPTTEKATTTTTTSRPVTMTESVSMSTLSPVTTSAGQSESSVSLVSATMATTAEAKSLLETSSKTGSENVNTTPTPRAHAQENATTDTTEQDQTLRNSTLLTQPYLQTSTPYNILSSTEEKFSTERTVIYSIYSDSSVLYVVIATIPCFLLFVVTVAWLCLRRQSKLRSRHDSKSYAIVPKEDTSLLTNMTSATTLRTIPDVVPSAFLTPGVSMPNINKSDLSLQTGTHGGSLSDLSSPSQSPGGAATEASRKRWTLGPDTPLVARWRSEDWEKDQAFMAMMASRLQMVNSNAEITEL